MFDRSQYNTSNYMIATGDLREVENLKKAMDRFLIAIELPIIKTDDKATIYNVGVKDPTPYMKEIEYRFKHELVSLAYVLVKRYGFKCKVGIYDGFEPLSNDEIVPGQSMPFDIYMKVMRVDESIEKSQKQMGDE